MRCGGSTLEIRNQWPSRLNESRSLRSIEGSKSVEISGSEYLATDGGLGRFHSREVLPVGSVMLKSDFAAFDHFDSLC